MRPKKPPRLRERLLASWCRVADAAASLFLAFSLLALARGPLALWGLPNKQHYFSYHPDEIFLLLPSFGFAAGDWNPHFFNYGTLYIYLVGIPAVLLGKVPPLTQFPMGLAPLYETGRVVTELLGIATVVALYLALRRASFALAALAAVLLALCPLHIVSSAYATVDVPATFWLVIAFWLALWGSKQPNASRGAPAGLAVGLAAATKYNAGLFLVPAMLAPLLARPVKWDWAWLAAGLGGAAVGFTIGCPFCWTPDFVRGVLFEARHAAQGGTLAFVGTGSGWAYHLLHGLPVGLGYPLLAAVVLAVPVAVALPSRPLRLSLLWVVLYLVVIGFSKERFIRYLVPLTPFLCVLASGGFLWLGSLSRRRWAPWTAAALAVGVVALTGIHASSQGRRFVHDDPRDQALGPVSGLFTMGESEPTVGLVQRPWYSDPPASPHNSGPFLPSLFDQWNESTGRHVVVTGWSVEKLQAEQPDVFFLSDLESQDLLRLRDPAAVAFLAALDHLYPGRREFARPGYWGEWLAPPRSWAPPDWLYPDPHITMYYRPRPRGR
jgi:hypothetical protein